jgi:hypothetical protein
MPLEPFSLVGIDCRFCRRKLKKLRKRGRSHRCAMLRMLGSRFLTISRQ